MPTAHDLVAIIAHEQDTDDVASPEDRAAALEQLMEMGAAAVPALLEGLATTNVAYVQRAFVHVGESAVEPLLAVLTTAEDAQRRANAALILGKLADQRAKDPLIVALNDSSTLVRKEAAQALAVFKASEMVLPLCSLLQDEEPEVRSRAALTLGAQGDVRAVEPLNDAFLRDDNERVRRAAHDAMKRIGERSQQESVADIDLIRAARAAETLQKPHDKTDTDEIERKAEQVGEEKLFHTFGIPRIDLLLATLDSKDHNVQRRAVRELIRMGDKVVEPLLRALEQVERTTTRAHIAFALGELGNAAALPALRDMLHDDVEDVHYAANNAIRKIEGTANAAEDTE